MAIIAIGIRECDGCGAQTEERQYRIFEGYTLCLDCVAELPLCECCGENAPSLIPVEDKDPSVGYHATLNVCPRCAEKKRRAA